MLQGLGIQALVNICSHIIFIILTWHALQAIRFDEIFKKSRVFEARLVMMLLTITIGSTVSHFFIDLINWTQQIIYLF